MKIGYFTDVYYPQTNGVVMSISIFGGELVKRGHGVHVFSPEPDRKTERGMRIHYRKGIPFTPYPGYKMGCPWGSVPKLDIIHSHGPFTMGISAIHEGHRQGIPLVATFHTMLPDYTHYLFPYFTGLTAEISKAYCYWHYSYYDRIVVPSHVIKDKISQWIPKGKRRSIEVIPTGTNTELFRPIRKAEARKKMNLHADGKIYLYLGRVGKEKNLDVLLKAAKKFMGKNDLLVLAGKGPWEGEMHRLVHAYDEDGEVRYIGFMDRKDVPYCYAAADLFITPSESETQGLVLTEAMACGTHVLAADALAIPEIIKDGVNGRLFNAGDPDDLARKVKEYQYDRNMLREGYKTAKEFSIQSSVDKAENMYKELTGKR